MFRDVATFIVIWILVVVAFTLSSYACFRDLEYFTDLNNCFLFWLQAAVGSHDLHVFDGLLELENPKPNLRMYGIYLCICYVILNILILVNFVIAMMADTYAAMTAVRVGIYNYKIIESATNYKIDKYYGGLVMLFMPLSFLSVLFVPVYLCFKDSKYWLLTITNGLKKAWYAVLLVPISVLFIAFNIILVPFAFVKTVFHKCKLANRGKIDADGALGYLAVGFFALLIA